MDDNPYAAIQLKPLTEALRLAEAEHHQELLLREGLGRVPGGCSCGITYNRGTEWEESKAHLYEVMARSMLVALHRPCDSCLGSGIWHRVRRDYECPECDGRGRTLTPLPPMTFQDADGDPWVVGQFEANGRESTWTQVFREL